MPHTYTSKGVSRKDTHGREHLQVDDCACFSATHFINRQLRASWRRSSADHLRIVTHMHDALLKEPLDIHGNNPLQCELLGPEGFAGSFPLKITEWILSIDTKGEKVGRFSRPGCPNWSVNDLDYFIACSDKLKFLNRVQTIVQLLKDTLGAQKIKVENPRLNIYVSDSDPIWIVDVSMRNIKPKLSFVQSHHSSLKDVIDNFDISIVKVVFDCKIEMVCASTDVVQNVISGTASVRDFLMDPKAPTPEQAHAVCSTIKRMSKYGARGHRFFTYPLLIKSVNMQTWMDTSFWIMTCQFMCPLHLFFHGKKSVSWLATSVQQ